MQKHLLPILLLLIPLCYIEAKQKSPFRLENDTILHICSNLSKHDSRTFHEILNPPDSLLELNWNFKNIVIDEGVDSVDFHRYPLISTKRISVPSSLKTLYFHLVPPGLEEVLLSPKNPYMRWENGTLYNRDKTCLYFILPNAVDSVLLIPETVKQVWTLGRISIVDDYRVLHYSKIVFPKQCERYPESLPSCDSLIIQSEHCPELSEYDVERSSYLYCLSDSFVTHFLMKDSWNRIRGYKDIIDRGKFHCPNYDVRKRDTSWMRENYRLTCILENEDTLTGVDSLPSGWPYKIKSAKIEGIADKNVYFWNQDQDGKDVYRFYVATYDTLYRLPLEVFVKPEEKKPEPKWSDFGEVKDSVLTIREDVDSFPYLRGSFRKVIIPKRTHYLRGSIKCDSAYLYSDSLETSGYYENVWDKIDAHYYYVENEELYLSLKRRLMEKNQFQKSMEIRRPAVVYCPHADVRKRNMALRQNTNKPVWKDEKGNEIKNLTYRPMLFNTWLQAEIEGMSTRDLYVFDCQRKRLLQKDIRTGFFNFINVGETADLEYAVWTYDTLLPLQQKDTVKMVKRDGTSWGVGYNWKECVLYYVPKGETIKSILESGKKPLLTWRSGDTIPRQYAKRLAFGFMLTNGECVLSNVMHKALCIDKQNYFWNDCLDYSVEKRNKFKILKVPSRYKEFWLYFIAEDCPNCIRRHYPSMHFYIGK